MSIIISQCIYRYVRYTPGSPSTSCIASHWKHERSLVRFQHVISENPAPQQRSPDSSSMRPFPSCGPHKSSATSRSPRSPADPSAVSIVVPRHAHTGMLTHRSRLVLLRSSRARTHGSYRSPNLRHGCRVLTSPVFSPNTRRSRHLSGLRRSRWAPSPSALSSSPFWSWSGCCSTRLATPPKPRATVSCRCATS